MATLDLGAFTAKETILVCARGCTDASNRLVTVRSKDLRFRVSPGGVYGYDIEVWVGIERFLYHRQRSEIQRALIERHGIQISTGQISILAMRFLRHLEQLHQLRAPVLRETLAADGGYPMHIDATGEDGRGTLYVVYTSWRKWALGAWKLSTERADLILPCLQDVVRRFGVPCAIMRDLGRAVIAAANDLKSQLDADFPILGCHRHFLGDIGKDLLEDSHNQLRELVRRFKLRSGLRTLSRDLAGRLGSQLAGLRPNIAEWTEEGTDHTLPTGLTGLALVRALAQWVLDYPQDGLYGSFPFDRPFLDLYNRCLKVRRSVDAFFRTPPKDTAVRRALERLARILDPVVSQVPFATLTERLARRAELFDELRDALRLIPRPKPTTPPDSVSDNFAVAKDVAELNDIRAALDTLVASLRERRPERGPAKDQRQAIDLILKHVERHGESLWGHVITGDSPEPKVRVVPRTNNDLEGFFHQMKHGERRRSGRKNLTQDFESLPAAAALVPNLTRPDYVQLLCGSLDNLPRAFADLDLANEKSRHDKTAESKSPEHPVDSEVVSASLPRVDRPFVRTTGLRRRIEAAARSRAPRFEPPAAGGRTASPTEF